MESYSIFRDLAIILVTAKCFGILARKCKAPQVAGEIVAGLLLGPSILGIVQNSGFMSQLAEIGVILLMFSAGLTTDLKKMIRTGPAAFLVACCGVFVPLAAGTLLYILFYGTSAFGTEGFYRALFIGCIMTATSVSITVQTLREMGHLQGMVGTTLLSAAIIDDVIGIIVLTFVIGFQGDSTQSGWVIIQTGLFFLFSIVAGLACYRIFRYLDAKYPHTQGIQVFGISLCFALSYIAEMFFGIADITGAFVAGIILCSIKDSDYIAKQVDGSSYILFGPVFFVSIGLKTDISGVDGRIIGFSAAFILVALAAKVAGCGLISRVCRFSASDSLKIGVGMMTRGEVALIVAQKGLAVGLMEPVYFTAVILLIIVSSIVTPILLKLLYAKYPEKDYA